MSKKIVILSGWGFDESIWDPIVNCFNLGGYSVSILTFNDVFSVNEILLKAKYFIKNECEEDLIIIGWSMGSILAMELTDYLNSLMKNYSLFLISATYDFTDNDIGISNETLLKMISDIDKSKDTVISKFTKRCLTVKERALFKIKESNIENNALIAGLYYLMSRDVLHSAKKIVVPTALIHGEHDRICPPIASEVLLSVNDEKSLMVIRGAGHIPFYTNPDEVYNLINSKLKEFNI